MFQLFKRGPVLTLLLDICIVVVPLRIRFEALNLTPSQSALVVVAVVAVL